MLTWEEAETLIRQNCGSFASKLNEAASGNPTEGTFRDRLMPVIAEFCKEAGVDFAPKSEYSLISGGRPDTVFNRLLVEYKAPGKLGESNRSRSNDVAITQLKGYFDQIVNAEKQSADRLAGVVLDGNYLIFIRQFDTRWYVDNPVATSAESCARFLRYLIYLGYGRALTADNLVEDFGIDQSAAKSMIAALENALVNGSSPLVQKLFEQWQTFFSEVIEYKEAFTETKLRDLQRFAGRAGIDLGKDEQTAKRFFFAIHTYFAILVKLLAWLAVRRQMGPRLGTPSFGQLASYTSGELQRELGQLEDGRLFREWAKVTNLLEGDFFRWYLLAWNEDIDSALREVLARLDTYDPTTLEVDPESARDLLKKLYHYLLPKEIRHNLGEYYTPDWLAQRLLNQVDYAFFVDDPNKSTYVRDNLLRLRFLDTACGSGTFLILIIKRIREAARIACIPEREVLDAIVKNVVGFDLNPLAVIAARTNYLLALGSLLEQPHDEIHIPVYLADSVLTPYRGEDMFTMGIYHASTAVGTFEVPQEVVRADRMDRYCGLLEECIRYDVDAEVYLTRTNESLDLSQAEFEAARPILLATYEKIKGLHRDRLNGIWVRIIRNAFAPIFVQKVDYVIGNPPWVNWENLPDGYRDQKEVRRLWQFHGLFAHGGMDTILGKGKKDVSLLMTYEAMYRYLKEGGKLGFVITQSVFKTAGAGQGFRRFMLGDSTPVKVIHVDDMVELQPFEGASNRTSVVVLQKGTSTTYPVRYTYWRKTARGRIGFDSSLEAVFSLVRRTDFNAEPVNDKDKTSAWLTGRPKALKAIKNVLGKSDYEAHAGVYSGGANAVYWLEIVDRQQDGMVLASNIIEGQKREMPKVLPTVLESDLIYPLLRGKDVKRWKAEPSASILIVQDPAKRTGIDEKEMQLNYPKAWSYLKQFEALLRSRAAYKRYFRGDAPFYSMFDVGEYTFAPYKVVWPWISKDVRAAVVHKFDGKPACPEHNTSFLALDRLDEAYFVCALMNSAIGDFAIRSYYSGGGGGIGSPAVLQSVYIPKFNAANKVHHELADLSQKAHQLAGSEDVAELRMVEDEIDRAAAELWGITESGLIEIKNSLADMS